MSSRVLVLLLMSMSLEFQINMNLKYNRLNPRIRMTQSELRDFMYENKTLQDLEKELMILVHERVQEGFVRMLPTDIKQNTTFSKNKSENTFVTFPCKKSCSKYGRKRPDV